MKIVISSVFWKKVVSVRFAGAVGRQLPSVGHFRVLRGSQGTDCGCVVMSAECREGPSCAIVSCTPHSVLLTPTDSIRPNSPPIIRNSLRTH